MYEQKLTRTLYLIFIFGHPFGQLS